MIRALLHIVQCTIARRHAPLCESSQPREQWMTTKRPSTATAAAASLGRRLLLQYTHTHTQRSVAAFWLIARPPPPPLFISAKPVHVVTPTLRTPHLIRREDDDSSPSGETVGDDRRIEGVGPNHASDVSAVFVASDSSTLQPTHTHTHTRVT